MLRGIGGVIAGIAAWIAIVTVLNFGLRHGWAEYAAVERAMAFTLPMMIARLAESGVSSIASGYIAVWVGKRKWAPLGAGLVLLALFLPVHYSLWTRFPAWYHLTFLISLPVLSWLGGHLRRE